MRARVITIPALAQELPKQAQDAVASHPNSAARLEALGVIERERGMASAGEHLEQAARLAPSARRWMEVGANLRRDELHVPGAQGGARGRSGYAEAKLALADDYTARNQNAKARDLLRDVVASDGNDFVARKRLADLYAAAGWKSAALAEYRRLEKDFPAPLWLRRGLAAQYEKLGLSDRALALAKSELAQNFDDRTARDILVRIYQKRGDVTNLRACFADRLRLDPGDTEAMAGAAELAAGSGDLHAAESLLRRAIAIAPESQELREQFADLLAAAGKPVQERAQLAHVLEANPDQEDVRQHLAWERGAKSESDGDAAYLVNAASLAHEAQRAPHDDGSNATALADIRIERVRDNGLATVRVQQVFQINTDQGAREYASRTVQYAAGTQRLSMLAARLFKADGRELEAEDSGDSGAEESSAACTTTRARAPCAFPAWKRAMSSNWITA